MDHMEEMFDMPGGDALVDVTAVFDAAASEIAPGELIFMDGFSLFDSMGAFEIGEARMDSGMITEQDPQVPFNPLMPLLPQELCWILDRCFTCEMTWHAGSTLSQTVYTLLYVHHLQHIDPDLAQYPPYWEISPETIGLTTVVLRAAVVGLLKCCDLTWREMSMGKVHDMEDWQGEKCDVPLLESTPAELAAYMLDEACHWLRGSPLPSHDQEMLIDRLLLRKSLLELFKLSLPEGQHRIMPLVLSARNVLRRIRSQKSTIPGPDSLASGAFDPRITRRLPNFIPIRVVELPSQDATWDAVDTLLQGWEALEHLLTSQSLFAWEISGSIHAKSHRVSPPYIRSLTQSLLEKRNLVFGLFPLLWVVDHFFTESLGRPYAAITDIMRIHWRGAGMFSLAEIERRIAKAVLHHTRSYWFNPPRRRRHLMKSIGDWQIAYDGLTSLTSQLSVSDEHSQALIKAIPLVPLMWQVYVAREIILSGFQQDLYSANERPIAYWYAAQVIKLHLALLDAAQAAIPTRTHAHSNLVYQYNYLAASQLMCMAMCVLLYQPQTENGERMALNFRRRYKWLYTLTFPSNEEELVMPVSGIEDFAPTIAPLLLDEKYSRDSFASAKACLSRAASIDLDSFASREAANERLQGVRDLVEVCEQLGGCADVNQLRWSYNGHPWFPSVPLSMRA